ncbi:5'-nucleotidase surE (Nucleoside 5'-monophosphate phosphohydrolase) [Methylorubrum extorquens]|uniref:5'-nucleotidase SurE n=1 Tax=Methylorubrum extorquens TaxID=408 RepID=A0A2N9AKE2_METEX|nr:5'/3'-nucleotidase SurE [Methylorubrum zatmanii]ARO53242.1 5'/3'-nucleotidase SurE [Methylorubrum zatmanii]KQQ14914.1 stationary phase survival protein SurE [Methylobacterium sp. Leaf121]SOR27808.1 5'-nucleotidase surE (Nucleoside 5'-monophosphate phosphohydrolase) [Methylorubrum extorquens]
MRILVTNDDGIHAPGLETLEGIARVLSDDVWVVAPETDQSGVSHSLSLNDPLRLRQIGEKRFAVKGTPSDCIIMGVAHILKDHKPDLVLSGVNRGQNVAEDVTYSGTIAGAMEGTILGIRSIALSQAYGAGGRANLKWACAATHGPRVIEKILEIGIEPGILVNVNFPDCEPEDVQGVAVSAQGQRNQALLQIDARHDGRGNPYFWLAFAKARFEPGNGTDLKAIAENRISVTPLRLDLTDEPELTRFAAAFRA